jgi:cation diffusion facilitator CzcD-associated flavoprotein CzcO
VKPYLIRGKPAPGRAEGAIAPDPDLPRACVIGAGSSGIAAAKALYEARIPFDCFERGPRLGGMWVFENPNGLSGAYRTLEMNTSGPRMSYSDFPMPDYYRDYPMHWQVAEYFERYVDHFGIRETISFDTGVERVERRDDGVWEVTIADAAAEGGSERREYDAVLVGNGHHWDPRWPEPPFPGSFAGSEMHAHDYRDAGPLAGRRVLVVGVGNSGVDIACAASYVADATFLSSRRGVHVFRKRLRGKPIDQSLPPPWIPWKLKQKGFEFLAKRSGEVSDFGLPKPDHKVGHAHPTLSEELYDRLADGSVVAKPNIRELRGEEVLFEDGSSEAIDTIVYCTGYRVSFPFFDPGFISAPGNELPLFRRTIHPEIEGVYFLALAQPLGALMPMAEEQGKWIAEHIAGAYALPPEDEIVAEMEAERAAHEKRFYKSPRHTMEVDFDEWLAGVRKERKRGGKRAERGSRRGAVEARAKGPGAPTTSAV